MIPCIGCGRALDRFVDDARYDVLNPSFDLEGDAPPPGPYCAECFAATPTGGQVPAEPMEPVIDPDPVIEPSPEPEPAADVAPDPAPAQNEQPAQDDEPASADAPPDDGETAGEPA